MTWYQEWFGEEYLELYSHRDENEARQQVAFFRTQFGAVDGAILDLACGMGRHLQEFSAHGYRAVGCDLSYTLLRTGMTDYGPMPVARADMRSLPFGGGTFRGLVNFFTSFGYFATEEEKLRAKQMLVDGCSYEEVARTLGRYGSTIAAWHPGYQFTPAQIGAASAMARKMNRVQKLSLVEKV